MQVHAFCLLLLAAIVCDAADPTCDFRCVNDTNFDWFGTQFRCPTEKPLCNSKCKVVTTGQDPPKCGTVTELCPYTCTDEKISINGENYECPANMKCNEKFDSCTKICVGNPCPNQDMYTCIDEHTLSIFGITVNCPAGTICNREKKYPCAFCIDPSGIESKVASWLTKSDANAE